MAARIPRSKKAGRAMKQIHCPVTCGRPTRMTEAGWSKICAHYQAEADKPAGGWRSPSSYDRICRRCRGKKRPRELEIIDLKNMEEIRMASRPEKGTCDICGGRKLVKKNHGVMVCSTCAGLQGRINQNPAAVVDEVIRMHGRQVVEKHLGSKNLAKLSEQNSAQENTINEVRRILEAGATDTVLAVAKRRMVVLKKLDKLYNEAMDELKQYQAAAVAGGDVAFQVPDGYRSLASVLAAAIEQAASGKGKERHARAGEPFEQQKICEITRRVGFGFPLGQAIKKAEEAPRLGDRASDELLGAINYLAAAVLVMREEEATQSENRMATAADPGEEAA